MNLYRNYLFLMVCLMLCFTKKATSQDSSSTYFKVLHFPDKLFKKVSDKSSGIDQMLTSKIEKYLERLAKEEAKLKKKLAKKDSLAASRLFNEAEIKYASYRSKIQELSTKTASLRNKYIPHLDTLRTAFSLLEKSNELLKKTDKSKAQIKDALNKVDGLQDKFNQAEDVRKFIQERRRLLKEQLGKFGMAKDLKKLQKQVYYYQAQVDEYKRMFEDPSKVEAKALELLSGTQIFKDFFSKHSQLAGLFRLPGSSTGNSMVTLAGLQTREGVQQEMRQRFGSGSDIQQMMQQQVQGAKSHLSKLRDKVNQLGGSSSEAEMPDFKPNNQKTKRFKDRLELGTNLQTVKSNLFFPSTSDLGLSLGYKLNDKSIIGVGSSYKMGWGKDFKHISITHQGLGLRSFMDYNLKGSFWLSGGAEANYRTQFSNFDILKDYSEWQRSALLGLTKKYQVSKKVKGNMQLMYDFLWKVQVPRTQAVVFRLGYNFK